MSDIRVPQLAENAESGTVVNILVKVGDKIEKDQTVVEVESAKAVGAIPATEGGTVSQIYVTTGQEVKVGQPLIAVNGGAAAASAASQEGRPIGAGRAGDPVPPTAPSRRESPEGRPSEPAPPSGAPKSAFGPAASPTIRKIAKDLGIDLNKVQGSESGGRIVLEDLKSYISRLQQIASSGGGAPAAGASEAKVPAASVDFSKWGPVSKKPFTSIRQTISKRMVESQATAAHVHQFADADITDIMALRKEYAPAYDKKNARLTLTPIILKALVATLKKHPLFNASIDATSNEIVFKEYFHIGIAVDTENGLVVPVLRDVDKKDLIQLSQDLEALAHKARDRKVSLDDMKGGTFSVSNQGSIGGTHFTPIINQPEVAILGIGQGVRRPAYVGGRLEPRVFLPLVLGYDHRLIDGGSAARFIRDLVEALENFSEAEIKRPVDRPQELSRRLKSAGGTGSSARPAPDGRPSNGRSKKGAK